MPESTPKIVITAGEPAGIGPDIVLAAATREWQAQIVCVADRELLAERARLLNLDVSLTHYRSLSAPEVHTPGTLPVVHIPGSKPTLAGKPDPDNACYVLATLNWATDACLSGEFAAMVTAPVQKSTIADSGIAFTGHTEFLADITDTNTVLMLLAAGDLRVALATTHLPLAAVPTAITPDLLMTLLRILHRGLVERFGIASPRITVLGLNPHAGEDGHLGREELDVIGPVCDTLRTEGYSIRGPVPADTAFSRETRAHTDAYLAMYHDQGLPVLKALGFGEAVNITLGLPIIRTSVDHGTALSLAGTGAAQPTSLYAAIQQAIEMANTGKGAL